MKEKKYHWAVITESKGAVQWKNVALSDTRKTAREMKKWQKAVWKMCSGVEVSLHKALVTKKGAIMVGGKVHY